MQIRNHCFVHRSDRLGNSVIGWSENSGNHGIHEIMRLILLCQTPQKECIFLFEVTFFGVRPLKTHIHFLSPKHVGILSWVSTHRVAGNKTIAKSWFLKDLNLNAKFYFIENHKMDLYFCWKWLVSNYLFVGRVLVSDGLMWDGHDESSRPTQSSERTKVTNKDSSK